MKSELAMVAVHAHPDDESSKGGATMAKYAAEGVRVVVATFTGGERGGILNPHLPDRDQIRQHLPEVRRAEMAAAARLLGVEHRFMGFVDSGFPEGDPKPPPPAGSFAVLSPNEAARPLVELIREVTPQVLVTYNESGGYPHPDHIQTHVASIKALEMAADPAVFPELGPAFTVPKVYYERGFSLARLVAIDNAMRQAGMDSAYGDWISSRRRQSPGERPATTRIEVADFFDARDGALRAHATQIDPDGRFFFVPRAIEQAVWPWEEFDRVTPVPTPGEVETDLFAGQRG